MLASHIAPTGDLDLDLAELNFINRLFRLYSKNFGLILAFHFNLQKERWLAGSRSSPMNPANQRSGYLQMPQLPLPIFTRLIGFFRIPGFMATPPFLPWTCHPPGAGNLSQVRHLR
jgi:hypothetical protein